MADIFALLLKKRIFIATGIYPPEIGGPAYYARGLEDAFMRQGYAVEAVTYGAMKKLPTGIRHAAYFLKLWNRIVWSGGVVIALDTFSVGLPAVIAGKLAGRTVAIRTGGDFLWEFYVEHTGERILFSEFYRKPRRLTLKENIIFFGTRSALRHADAVAFSTRYQRDIFVSAYALDPAKTAVIENFYGPKERAAPASRKNFICFTRKLVWKNLGVLARSFEKARRVADGISLETGSLPRGEYLEKLKDCYAVILASLGDISPNMILEAIQYGKPFILTTENGIEDRIRSVGLRVDPLREDEIAEAIVSLADPALYERERKKISAFSFIHSYDDIAREFLAFIQQRQ